MSKKKVLYIQKKIIPEFFIIGDRVDGM